MTGLVKQTFRITFWQRAVTICCTALQGALLEVRSQQIHCAPMYTCLAWACLALLQGEHLRNMPELYSSTVPISAQVPVPDLPCLTLQAQ